MAFPVAPRQNGIQGLINMSVGPLKLWQVLAIVALLFFLDRQGIVDVPLIGGQKRAVRRIRRH